MGLASILLLLALAQEPVPFRDMHRDGKTPEEVGARLTLSDGRVVLHGPYERFHRNGNSAAKGQFDHGERTGAWELRHEDGKMRARGKYVHGLEDGPWVEFHAGTAKKASEGSYRAGLRAGKWTFWEKDGKRMDFPTGNWEVVEEKDAHGRVRARGSQIENTKDGVWLHLWPNGAVQFVARFELGRLDQLFFLHPDGTLDPGWLSRRSLTRELPEWAEAFRASLPRADLPLEVPSEARARVAGWLASGTEAVEPPMLAEARGLAPAAVEVLRACTLESADGRERARRLHGLLCQLFGGVGWDWAATDASLLVRRWGSAWELLGPEEELWQLDFDPRWRWIGHDLGSSVLLRPPLLEEVQSGGGRFSGRFGGPRAPFPKETLERAATWLSAQQTKTGTWVDEQGDEVADTALVLLVLLGEHSHRTGAHQAAVQRGLLALRERSTEAGVLASVRAHALITWLYAELYELERAPGLSLLVREHSGTLLARSREDGSFSPDPFEDALARFALALAASNRLVQDKEALTRLLTTSEARAQIARAALRPGSAACTMVGVGLLVQLFGGPRPAREVLESYSDWLASHPPEAQTPPEETVFGAWAATQLGKPAGVAWSEAIEGPLRSGWQTDGTYLAQRTTASRLEATCLAALTLQHAHRWSMILARR